MESDESSSEDFRSVIDDLTVENNRLKQKLWRFEKLHCFHLQGDKLFEVHMHQLPIHKKRELEETLRVFASTLGNKPEKSSSIADQGLLSPSAAQPRAAHKPSSSSMSFSQPIDSAYASMSASAQTSVSTTQAGLEKHQKTPMTQGNCQSFDSYLKDIPESLLPKRPLVMTDRAKKRLIVERLEQLFTDKGAILGHQSQSPSQQEGSHLATDTKRHATAVQGRKSEAEGEREARILSVGGGGPLHLSSESRMYPLAGEVPRSGRRTTSSNTIIDQRPTRPLDLDPFRAQVAAKNVQYIRQLRMEPPEINVNKNSPESAGWVYLNLMIGMAQLHTTNVTPGFVRKAISQYSVKFELSKDGRKIRWVGGTEGTQMSSRDNDSGAEQSDASSSSFGFHEPGGVSCKTMLSTSSKHGSNVVSRANVILHSEDGDSSTDFGGDVEQKPLFLPTGYRGNEFDYKPLLYHETRPEDLRDPSSSNPDSTVSSGSIGGFDVVGSAPNHLWTLGPAVKPFRGSNENGLIIYYKRANFCTDLSRDSAETARGDTVYTKPVVNPLGTDSLSDVDCELGYLENDNSDYENLINCEDAQLPYGCLSGIESLRGSHLDTGYPPIVPYFLEASGVGGVQPRDNFVIDVHTKYVSTSTFNACRVSNKVSPKPVQALRESTYLSERNLTQTSEIIYSKKTTLIPSKLPPPSYILAPCSSSESEESEDNSSISSSENYGWMPKQEINVKGHSVLINPACPSRSTDEARSSSSDGESDGSSIDLLAHARELYPDTIAAREREFDLSLGRIMIEDIPAGSSAATVGGGSGYSSPDSGLIELDNEARHSLKRLRSEETFPIRQRKVPRIQA